MADFASTLKYISVKNKETLPFLSSFTVQNHCTIRWWLPKLLLNCTLVPRLFSQACWMIIYRLHTQNMVEKARLSCAICCEFHCGLTWCCKNWSSLYLKLWNKEHWVAPWFKFNKVYGTMNELIIGKDCS